jgi:hypothetical protein
MSIEAFVPVIAVLAMAGLVLLILRGKGGG